MAACLAVVSAETVLAYVLRRAVGHRVPSVPGRLVVGAAAVGPGGNAAHGVPAANLAQRPA